MLEALDLPVAAGAPGAGARTTSPLERLAAIERTERRPAGAAAAGDEPLTLSFSAIDDYLTCPRKYKLAHVLRVPVAPHHAMIYGSALHAAVAEFHRRHARGDVMTEDELFARSSGVDERGVPVARARGGAPGRPVASRSAGSATSS